MPASRTFIWAILHKCQRQWIKINFLQYHPESGFCKKVIHRPKTLLSLKGQSTRAWSLNKQRQDICVSFVQLFTRSLIQLFFTRSEENKETLLTLKLLASLLVFLLFLEIFSYHKNLSSKLDKYRYLETGITSSDALRVTYAVHKPPSCPAAAFVRPPFQA